MSRPWLSTEEIAVHLGVIRHTAYGITDLGAPAHKGGRVWPRQVDEFGQRVCGDGRSSATELYGP